MWNDDEPSPDGTHAAFAGLVRWILDVIREWLSRALDAIGVPP